MTLSRPSKISHKNISKISVHSIYSARELGALFHPPPLLCIMLIPPSITLLYMTVLIVKIVESWTSPKVLLDILLQKVRRTLIKFALHEQYSFGTSKSFKVKLQMPNSYPSIIQIE